MKTKRTYRAILCSLLFGFLAFVPHRATAKACELTPKQQKLVNHCISVIWHGDRYDEKYAIPSQRLLAKMSNRELRHELEPCLAGLRAQLRLRSKGAFAVACMLALRGVGVRKNFDIMNLGSAFAEESYRPLGAVYQRHPSDFILQRIVRRGSTGAGGDPL